MFAAWCEPEAADVLLSERRILSVDLAPEGVVVRFRCWCGSEGSFSEPRWPARRGSGAHLAVAPHDELGRGELAQPHRSAGVELLGADADLGAEAELVAVHEPG